MKPRTKSEGFDAELVEGHKGVVVAVVPFDPERAWRSPPVRLAGRRHGWLVQGTLNRAEFEGYVGERWGRFFVIVDEALRTTAGVCPGDHVRMTIMPTAAPEAFARAVEQSKATTQPSKCRPDAIIWSKPAP